MIFGSYPIEAPQLVKRLNEHATRIVKPHEGTEAWTIAIKRALQEIAVECRCKCLCTDKSMKQSEFMLDAVWWQEDQTGAAAVLAAECEWASWERKAERRANVVGHDFEKLLQFKAPMKLMIFEPNTLETRIAIHRRFEEYLRRFRQHVAGELYVFVDFSYGSCFSYVCEINRDGRNEELSLTPMNTESRDILNAA